MKTTTIRAFRKAVTTLLTTALMSGVTGSVFAQPTYITPQLPINIVIDPGTGWLYPLTDDEDDTATGAEASKLEKIALIKKRLSKITETRTGTLYLANGLLEDDVMLNKFLMDDKFAADFLERSKVQTNFWQVAISNGVSVEYVLTYSFPITLSSLPGLAS